MADPAAACRVDAILLSTFIRVISEGTLTMPTQPCDDGRRPYRAEEINRRSFLPLLGASAVSLMLARNAQAQQIPFPQTAAEVPGPVSGTAMTIEYDQMVGSASYFWGYPLVATNNRRVVFSKVPQRILLGGAVPMAPVGYNTMLTDYIKPDEDFIVCPNQDVVYGGGFTALDKEPTVFRVPDFGNRYWVYPLYDIRTDDAGPDAAAQAPRPAARRNGAPPGG